MADLTKYANRSTVKLTTTGRKSGKPRTVTIWFVVTGPRTIEVQHASDPLAQWYKNLVGNGDVSLDFGDGALKARATPILEPEGVAAVLSKIRKKHWLLGPLIQMRSGNAKPVAATMEME